MGYSLDIVHLARFDWDFGLSGRRTLMYRIRELKEFLFVVLGLLALGAILGLTGLGRGAAAIFP